MKIYLFLSTIFLLCGCTENLSRNTPNDLPKGNISYYIYFDSFDDNKKELFKQQIKKLDLQHNFPPQFESITFKIFSANNLESLHLDDRIQDGRERFTELKAFFTRIDQFKTLSNDITISKSLERIVNDLSIADKNYIILVSDLIENAGGAIGSDSENSSWQNGYFRFAEIENNEYTLISNQITEFDNQINNESSWIGRNIIKKAKQKKISGLKIISNNQNIQLISLQNGLDKTTIEDVWSKLFEKIGVKFENFSDLTLDQMEFKELKELE